MVQICRFAGKDLQTTPPPGYSTAKPSDAALSNIMEVPPQTLQANQQAGVTQAPREEGIVAVKKEQEPARLPASLQSSPPANATGIEEASKLKLAISLCL